MNICGGVQGLKSYVLSISFIISGRPFQRKEYLEPLTLWSLDAVMLYPSGEPI
jgi:hypothetical protein